METDTKAQVWAKTQGHCWYCGKCMNPWEDFTIDHMDPRKQGGGDELANLAPCCKTCNSRKNAKSIEEFRGYLQGRDHQFWFESNVKNNPFPIQENDEDEEDSDLQRMYECFPYLSYHCSAIGCLFSTGCAITLLDLLHEAIDRFVFDDNGNPILCEWMYSIEDIAYRTNQPKHHIVAHFSILMRHELLDIDSSQSTYILYLGRLRKKLAELKHSNSPHLLTQACDDGPAF